MTVGSYPNVTSWIVNAVTGATTPLPGDLFQNCQYTCPWVGNRFILYLVPKSAHSVVYDIFDTQTMQPLGAKYELYLPYPPVIHGNSVYYVTANGGSCNTSLIQRMDLPSGAITTLFTVPGVISVQGLPGGSLGVTADGRGALFIPFGPIGSAGTNCQQAPNYANVQYVTASGIHPIDSSIPGPAIPWPSAGIAPDGSRVAFMAPDGSIHQVAPLNGAVSQNAPPPQTAMSGATLSWAPGYVLSRVPGNSIYQVFAAPIGSATNLAPVLTVASQFVIFAPGP